MSELKKYYWLKLKKDFFKRHDILIIESMTNGKDYLLFYMKLLLESVDHDGNLRFNDTIPYSENMLSTITNTNIDMVRSAMKIFIDLKMIEVLEDQTIFMNEIKKMLGTETYWAEQKRKQRVKNNNLIGQCPNSVLEMSNVSNQELDTDIDTDIDTKYSGMTNGMTQVRLGKDSIGKVKLDKTNYSEFVKLTVAEYDRLISEFGEDAVKRMIEILDNYKGANGKKYADDNRAIRNWVVKRWQDEEAQTKLFDGKSLSVAEKARRLQKDYERNNSFKTDNANKGYISVL